MGWPVQDAKARFSELIETVVEKGPQIVTRRGVETAVIVPIEEWRRLKQAAGPSLKEWLLAPEPNCDIPIPPRGANRHREPVEFE